MIFFWQTKRKFFQLVSGLAFVLMALPGYSQTGIAIRQNEVLEISRESPLMQRKMSYRVILPAAYKRNEQKRFPVIYLLHGRGGNYRDWSNLTKIEEYSFPYEFIVVMPDGGTNGWYTDNQNVPNDAYESYFVQELIPDIEREFRAATEKSGRIVAGLSMGGYGALKFGLKYPEKFIVAGSFSGALDAVVKTEKYPHLIESVKGVFGAEDSSARAANDIFRLVREASPEQIKTFPFLFIECGMTDHQFQANRDFVALLTERKIPHEYRQMPGEHNWKFWDSEIQEFLQAADKIIFRAKASPKTKNK